MKTLMTMMMVTLIATAQSSGREPGAAIPEPVEAVEQSEGGCSGLPPGALFSCTAEETTTFFTIDITIDPKGQSLGAFQFEMISPDTTFSVVGVEAGDHDAFNHGRPPYFDPVAQQDQTDRLILAEYAKTDLAADQLPNAAVRVATVHVMLTIPEHDQPEPPEPLIQLTLTGAGNAEGERIDAQISYTFRTPERPE